jgi:hypothetical protein
MMQIGDIPLPSWPMNALAVEVDQTLRSLDERTAVRFERLVRDALDLVKPASAAPVEERERWLERLDSLRGSVGTGKTGTSTEAILEDLRADEP